MSRYEFRLPDLGEGIIDSEIVAWHVDIGDQVEMDQPVVDVMTNKATIEITAPVAGLVIDRSGNPGEILPVGATLLVFDTGSARPPPPGTGCEKSRPDPADSDAAANRPLGSPAVRKRARELGIPLGEVRGSGPGGRILLRDLQPYPATGSGVPGGAPPGEAGSGVIEIPLIGVRRQIADKMDQGNSVPAFAYVEEVDVTSLESLRRHLNTSRLEDQPELSYLPLIILALVKTLRRYPAFNAHYDVANRRIRQFRDIHAGIATHTRDGLKVPVLRNAETLDVWGCARELRRLSAAARDNTIRGEEMSGSTISITSLGKLGGLAVIPIIHSPEVAIIGINRAEERPVVRDNTVVIRRMMNLSSCFDHRIIDGQDAAQMIQHLKGLLENPATLFI